MGAPRVNTVSLQDLTRAIGAGLVDWHAAPLLSIALASIYTVGGWFVAALMMWLRLPYLVYPLAMGFALIAPFVAVSFYEVSRLHETGERPTLSTVVAKVWAARHRDLRWMALITSFAFFIWIDIAAMVTLGFFGATALDLDALVREIFTTPDGLMFLVVGHLVGAAIALLVFSISVVSFPMLYDRDVDVFTAIATSVRLVCTNPVVMAVWCGAVAASIGVALATGLLLLPLVLPVLGYASWHLYRHAVCADDEAGR